MATRKTLCVHLTGDIEDRFVRSRSNPEGFSSDDEDLSDAGAETFTGLYTDLEASIIQRIDDKRAEKARAKAVRTWNKARNRRIYGDVSRRKPATKRPECVPNFRGMVEWRPGSKAVSVIAKSPVVAPKPAPAPAPKPTYIPVNRPANTMPGRSTSAPHPALALRSRPLRPMPRQIKSGVRTGTHRRP
jgi:hypothetical protein